jgi:SAM-dependent methyltransferase
LETADGEQVEEGSLRCGKCRTEHAIIDSIPRFVPFDNDASSFGFQWTAFARVQTDASQMPYNHERFFATTDWPKDLRGELILEAGCGAGRFSGVALQTGAELYSFDLSRAVDACFDNVDSPERHHLFQADITAIPLPHGMFDKIFCLGVLQHTADVKKSYLSLIPFLKPGGELAADCYLSQPLKHAFNLKYWLRPFFKWWKPSMLLTFWSAVISISYDLKSFLARIPVMGKTLASLIPIGRLNFEPEMKLTISEIKEIKTLSVIDMLSPKYDQCKKLSDFEAWTREAGLELVKLTLGYNGVNVRVRRPLR